MMRWLTALLSLLCVGAYAQGPLFDPAQYRKPSGISFSNEAFVVFCGVTNKAATGAPSVLTNWTMLVASNVAAADIRVGVAFFLNASGGPILDNGVSVKASYGATTVPLTFLYGTNYNDQHAAGFWYAPLGNLPSNMLTITVSNNNTWDGIVGVSAAFHNANQTNTPVQFATNYATLDGSLSTTIPARTNDHVTMFNFTAAWDELSLGGAFTFNGGGPVFSTWNTNSTFQMAGLSGSNHMTSAECVITEQDAVPANPTWTFLNRVDYLTNPPTASSAAWYMQLESADADADNQLDPSTLIWCDVTLPTGNCTKLRAEVSLYAANTTLELGLYNTSGTLLQSASQLITGNGMVEMAITSQAVTAGTYYIGFVVDDINFIALRWKNGVGTTHYNPSLSPAGALPSSLPSDSGPITRSYVVGAYVE